MPGRRRWIAVVASEPDRRVAREVGTSLSERVQIDILFLDSSVSSGQLEHLLASADAYLFFVSLAAQESRLFSNAIETAIRFSSAIRGPRLIPVWMGPYLSEHSPAYGLTSFHGVRWQDGQGTAKLIRELSTVLDGLPAPGFELGDSISIAAPQRSAAPQAVSAPPSYSDTVSAPALPSAQPRISPFQRLSAWARRWQIQPTADLPEGRLVDNVNLSLTAPANLAIGQVHELRFWAHLEAQTATVMARALAALAVLDPRKLLVKTEGPFTIARGTSLEIIVSIDDLLLRDRSKAILWTGEIGSVAFLVDVPAQCSAGPKPGSASVRVAGTEIAKISFVLQVGIGSTKPRRVRTGIKRHKMAFASYATEDRDAVLARIQGIQKVAPSLKVFVDVMSLRSGQDWERRLYQTIAETDVFYLFWCRHARQSEWVEKEWRCAVQAKGIDFIDPVPLESPAFAPPPPELNRKYFNEPILAYITSTNHPPPQAKSFHVHPSR